MPISRTTTVRATPQEAYALVSDLPRMGELSPENTGGRWLKGATGPAVGARFKGTNRNGVRRWSTTATVEVADVSVVILRMSRVSTVDATGALVLREAIQRLEGRGITVLVSGVRKGHDRPLMALGVLSRLHDQGRVFETTPEAIEHAHGLLHENGALTGAAVSTPQ